MSAVVEKHGVFYTSAIPEDTWYEPLYNTNINQDEINIMNTINDNTFNLPNNLLNNDNRYMTFTLKA